MAYGNAKTVRTATSPAARRQKIRKGKKGKKPK